MDKRMLYRVALGVVLREERLAQGLTLRKVSQQAPMALGYLSEIERGSKELSSEALNNLAINGLGVEPHELIFQTAMLMSGIEIPDTADDFIKRVNLYAEMV